MGRNRDYYDILGVPRSASHAEIRRAFRQRARQIHPDVNPAPDATQRMQELNHAYLILSNPLNRAMYDRRYGSTTSSAGHRPPSPESRADQHTRADQQARQTEYRPPAPRPLTENEKLLLSLVDAFKKAQPYFFRISLALAILSTLFLLIPDFPLGIVWSVPAGVGWTLVAVMLLNRIALRSVLFNEIWVRLQGLFLALSMFVIIPIGGSIATVFFGIWLKAIWLFVVGLGLVLISVLFGGFLVGFVLIDLLNRIERWWADVRARAPDTQTTTLGEDTAPRTWPVPPPPRPEPRPVSKTRTNVEVILNLAAFWVVMFVALGGSDLASRIAIMSASVLIVLYGAYRFPKAVPRDIPLLRRVTLILGAGIYAVGVIIIFFQLQVMNDISRGSFGLTCLAFLMVAGPVLVLFSRIITQRLVSRRTRAGHDDKGGGLTKADPD